MAEQSKKPVYIGPATSKVVNPLTGQPMETNEVYYDPFTKQPLIYGEHPIDEYDIMNPWTGPASTYPDMVVTPNGEYKEVIDYNTVPENYVGSEVQSNYTYNPISDFNLTGLDKALYGVRGGDGKAYQGDFTKDFMLGFIPKLADPTSYARLAYDAAFDRENLAQNYTDGIGLVSRDFYNEHPYISEAINLAAGFAAPFAIGKASKASSLLRNAPGNFVRNVSRNVAPVNKTLSENIAYFMNKHMPTRMAITPYGTAVRVPAFTVNPETVERGLKIAEALTGGTAAGLALTGNDSQLIPGDAIDVRGNSGIVHVPQKPSTNGEDIEDADWVEISESQEGQLRSLAEALNISLEEAKALYEQHKSEDKPENKPEGEPEDKPEGEPKKPNKFKNIFERVKNVLKKNKSSQPASQSASITDPTQKFNRFFWRSKVNTPNWTPLQRRAYNSALYIGLPYLVGAAKTGQTGTGNIGTGYGVITGGATNRAFNIVNNLATSFVNELTGKKTNNSTPEPNTVVPNTVSAGDDPFYNLTDSANNQEENLFIPNANQSEVLPDENNSK